MGPQHESCGKNIPYHTTAAAIDKLQWGRNMRVAESRRKNKRKQSPTGFNGAAT